MSWFDRFKKPATETTSPEPAVALPPAAPPAAPTTRVVPRARPARAAVPELPVFPVGEQIAGVYEVQRRLEPEGAFAAYLARHLAWNIPVVVKVAKAEVLGDAERLRQVERAVAQWVTLGRHPHVVCCYYLQPLNGVPLVVVEAVTGESLGTRVAGGSGADLRSGLDLAIQFCHGLEHAHAHGVIHGALHPDNVLIDHSGRLALTDFGIGRPARPDRAAYVAPEQWAAGGVVDVRADLFALGVCLCELLSGSLPYESTAGDPREAHVPTQSRDGAALPGPLCALLKRCVTWRREDRSAGAGEIREGLAAVYRALYQSASPSGELPAGSWAADGWNTRAVSQWFLGNETEADAAWDAALTAEPQHAAAAYNRALARCRGGHATREELMQQIDAVAVPPGGAWQAAYARAVAALDGGDTAAALPLLEAAATQAAGAPEVEAALVIARGDQEATGGSAAVLEGHDQYVTCLDISRDGRLALSGGDDRTLRLWDLETRQCTRVLEGHEHRVGTVCLSLDGRLALSGSDDRTMRLWDLTTGTCQHVFDIGSGRVFSVALSPDGRLAMMAASTDESVAGIEETNLQLWNLMAGRRQRGFEGHTSVVKAVALSGDGRWGLSGSDDHTVRLWDVVAGRCLRVFEGHQHYVSSVCFSADRHWALSGSWDGTVRLWETNTGRCARTLLGHTNLVTSVALSGDGRWALSGSWDKTVKIWAAGTGRCAHTFTGHTGLVTAVALSGDGRRAVSASWDKSVRLWEVPRLNPFGCPLILSGA